MKEIMSIVLFFFITLGAVSLSWAEDYQLGSGDILDISVLGFDELHVAGLTVRSDGKIAYPLLGELVVSGHSTNELTQIITAGIKQYVNQPVVTVNVIKFRTTRIYVLGEIARPGVYELEKQHTLLDAIGAAGSYTKDAAKKKIHIIRGNSQEKPVTVNLLQLLRQGDLSQNPILYDGDIVYLSGNGRIDLSRDILPYLGLIYQVKDFNDD